MMSTGNHLNRVCRTVFSVFVLATIANVKPTMAFSSRQMAKTASAATRTVMSLAPLPSDHAPLPSDHHPSDERRKLEFVNLEPLTEPDVRKRRLEENDRVRSRFVSFGDPLWNLRSKMDDLSAKLLNAITDGLESREEETRKKLRKVELKDAELVYMLETANYDTATQEGRTEDAKEHSEKAQEARSCLPQFNLEGLWVGKYGSHGYELINVTYSGDTLIAIKVTGDKNVPRSEITFQTDLHPMRHLEHEDKKEHMRNYKGPFLQPIELTDKAAQKWGTRQLPRYMGQGQVAEEGFVNKQMMDGQLIIIGEDYFSFAWTPIQQQIFFGRPSPELALKMLRESGVAPLRAAKTWKQPPSHDDDIQTQVDFLSRCFEVSDEVQEEHIEAGEIAGLDGYGCIFQDEESAAGYFE